jgi:hypothetical protein
VQAVSIARTISLGSSGRADTSLALSKPRPSVLRFSSLTPRTPSSEALRELDILL